MYSATLKKLGGGGGVCLLKNVLDAD